MVEVEANKKELSAGWRINEEDKMRRNYSQEYLQNILNQYSNLGTIDKFFLYTSGYENSNYYVETEKGKYVIKVFEGIGIKAENVLFELEVMDYSYKSGIKTPHLLTTKAGKLYVKVEQKFAIIMDFIDGENMHKKVLEDELVIEVAKESGKMDVTLKYFKDGSKTRQNYEWDLKNTLVLEKSLPLLPKEYDQEIFRKIFEEFRQIKTNFAQMPAGIIHNDIVPHNWLVKDGKLNGIIDFSDMSFSPYIQNVAVSLHLISFGYNWNPRQAKIFIDHYSKINPLSVREFSLLYTLVKARFLSFVIEFHRWNVEYEVDPLRVETVEDHYEFLKRFIEFGSEQFNQLIKI